LVIQQDGAVGTGQILAFFLFVLPSFLSRSELPIASIRSSDVFNLEIDDLMNNDRDNTRRKRRIRWSMNCIRLSLTIQLSLGIFEFGFISQSKFRTSQETNYSLGNRISFPCVRRSLLKSDFAKYPTSQWRSPGIFDPSFSPANLSTRDCILPPFKMSSCKSNSILPTISSAVRRSESQS